MRESRQERRRHRSGEAAIWGRQWRKSLIRPPRPLAAGAGPSRTHAGRRCSLAAGPSRTALRRSTFPRRLTCRCTTSHARMLPGSISSRRPLITRTAGTPTTRPVTPRPAGLHHPPAHELLVDGFPLFRVLEEINDPRERERDLGVVEVLLALEAHLDCDHLTACSSSFSQTRDPSRLDVSLPLKKSRWSMPSMTLQPGARTRPTSGAW